MLRNRFLQIPSLRSQKQPPNASNSMSRPPIAIVCHLHPPPAVGSPGSTVVPPMRLLHSSHTVRSTRDPWQACQGSSPVGEGQAWPHYGPRKDDFPPRHRFFCMCLSKGTWSPRSAVPTSLLHHLAIVVTRWSYCFLVPDDRFLLVAPLGLHSLY